MPTLLEEPVAERPLRVTTTVPGDREGQARYVSPEQHSLRLSIALHLLPGAALFGFVLVAAAVGMPAILGLLVGIALTATSNC